MSTSDHVALITLLSVHFLSKGKSVTPQNQRAYLLLGELLAAPRLADLVALVVPAGRALAAVFLARAADALAAALALLLGLSKEDRDSD